MDTRSGIDRTKDRPLPPGPRRFEGPDLGPRLTEQSHEAHFLSRALRCEGEDLDRAMHLYHNSRVVRVMAEHLLKELPEAERAAIPLRESARSPRVIVTRQGRFVTCLDETMDCTDVPQLPYARFAAAIEMVRETRADALRQLALLKRFDGRHIGHALFGGPARLNRDVAEVIIDGGGDTFGRIICDQLTRFFRRFNRYVVLHNQGRLDRRELIDATKIEGSLIQSCYLLAGIQSPAVAGILDFYARHDTGFDHELMLALSRQENGPERLYGILADRSVRPAPRDLACRFFFASMATYRDRVRAALEHLVGVPPDAEVPHLAGIQESARQLLAMEPELFEMSLDQLTDPSEELRPSAPHWIFSSEELLGMALSARPALQLFAPAAEAEAVQAAWDEWLRTRPLPPPIERKPVVRTAPRIRRNDPCPCGSGRKHKQCCLGRPAAPPAAAPDPPV